MLCATGDTAALEAAYSAGTVHGGRADARGACSGGASVESRGAPPRAVQACRTVACVCACTSSSEPDRQTESLSATSKPLTTKISHNRNIFLTNKLVFCNPQKIAPQKGASFCIPCLLTRCPLHGVWLVSHTDTGFFIGGYWWF